MSNTSPRNGTRYKATGSAGPAAARKPALLGLALLLALAQCPSALAAIAPSLGSASTYGIVSSTFTNNSNPTNINGSVCYTTAPVLAPTGITGATVTPCLPAVGLDQGTALATLNGQGCTSLGGGAIDLSAANVGSGPGVFPPGCYSSGGAMSVGAGTVTLNGVGVFIFRPAGTLTTANNTSIAIAGGACADNVFWAPAGATTLGANTAFVGNLLDGIANAVTMGNLTTVNGRILSFGGVVTTTSNTITVPALCPGGGGGGGGGGPGAGVGATSIPTLSEWALIALSSLVALFGLAQARRRRGSI